MSDFNQLIGGFRAFKATRYLEQKEIAGHLIRQGIKPKTLFVTCSDMRISPDVLFSSNPGDLFTLRNLGGLIPPSDNQGTHGMVAALEYAVEHLRVDNIVVLGHASCESIKTLMFGIDGNDITGEVRDWLAIADEAKDAVSRDLHNKDEDEKCAACGHEAILVSLKNLLTYKFIEKNLANDSLKIYGWHFDIQTGILLGFNPESKFFEIIG